MSDIVDRLTAAFLGHLDHVDRSLFGEARDEIVRLRAAVKRHKAIREVAEGAGNELYRGAMDRVREMERRARAFEAGAANLQAERDRLRDALTRLASTEAFHVATAEIPVELSMRIKFARAALKGDTP